MSLPSFLCCFLMKHIEELTGVRITWQKKRGVVLSLLTWTVSLTLFPVQLPSCWLWRSWGDEVLKLQEVQELFNQVLSSRAVFPKEQLRYLWSFVYLLWTWLLVCQKSRSVPSPCTGSAFPVYVGQLPEREWLELLHGMELQGVSRKMLHPSGMLVWAASASHQLS